MHYWCMTQLASARVTGAQQVHDKVLTKVHDDKVRDKVHDTAGRCVGGAARHKHAHGTTRHSSLEQMSERRTRAQKGHGAVFGGGAQVPPHAGAVRISVRMRRRGDAER